MIRDYYHVEFKSRLRAAFFTTSIPTAGFGSKRSRRGSVAMPAIGRDQRSCLMSGNENQRLPLQSIGLICPTGARRDFVSSPLSKNILLRGLVETAIHQAHPVPIRGAFRDRHGRGMGCGGRDGAFDERRQSGRRSRMVLTPRRWRQVCEMALSALTGLTRCAGDGDNKARSPERVRRKPLKPLRREGRVSR
jgi:hypothetical protein